MQREKKIIYSRKDNLQLLTVSATIKSFTLLLFLVCFQINLSYFCLQKGGPTQCSLNKKKKINKNCCFYVELIRGSGTNAFCGIFVNVHDMDVGHKKLHICAHVFVYIVFKYKRILHYLQRPSRFFLLMSLGLNLLGRKNSKAWSYSKFSLQENIINIKTTGVMVS